MSEYHLLCAARQSTMVTGSKFTFTCALLEPRAIAMRPFFLASITQPECYHSAISFQVYPPNTLVPLDQGMHRCSSKDGRPAIMPEQGRDPPSEDLTMFIPNGQGDDP